MNEFVLEADNEADTDRLGAALAELLPDGTVVALSGTLGAGKTRLVQGVAAAAGIDRQLVTSPTFVLCQSYQGRRTIHHFDVYRLQDDEEFLQLGPEEYFESEAISFVEWAKKVEPLLPAEHLDIAIDVLGPMQRRFTLRGRSVKLDDVVSQVKDRLTSTQ